MARYDAFDIQLDIGTAQTEYAVIACDTADGITGNGNGTFTVTHAGLAGSPLATNVALLIDDLPADVVTKAVAALNAIGAISTHMVFYAVGTRLYCRLVEASANDATLNIAYADGTCAGLTDDATSENGVAGVAKVETAAVTNIGGPGLGVDTEDVTTHDQATAYEEVVATIIRSGEVSLDIVYDPAAATHDASTGLVYRHEDKIYSYFELIFPDAANTTWTFFGYITGFEPGAPVDGALTATVKIKITAVPTLA